MESNNLTQQSMYMINKQTLGCKWLYILFNSIQNILLNKSIFNGIGYQA
jgi:hypothetical protein